MFTRDATTRMFSSFKNFFFFLRFLCRKSWESDQMPIRAELSICQFLRSMLDCLFPRPWPIAPDIDARSRTKSYFCFWSHTWESWRLFFLWFRLCRLPRFSGRMMKQKKKFVKEHKSFFCWIQKENQIQLNSSDPSWQVVFQCLLFSTNWYFLFRIFLTICIFWLDGFSSRILS